MMTKLKINLNNVREIEIDKVEDYGSYTVKGVNYTLLQEPYITGFTNHPIFEALSKDDEGNHWMLKWDVLQEYDPMVNDYAEACDWENPTKVVRVYD